MKFVTFSHKVEYIYTYHPNFSLSSDDLIHLAFEQIEPCPNLVSKRVSHDKTLGMLTLEPSHNLSCHTKGRNTKWSHLNSTHCRWQKAWPCYKSGLRTLCGHLAQGCYKLLRMNYSIIQETIVANGQGFLFPIPHTMNKS